MAEYIEREAVIAEIVAEAEKQGKKSYDMAEKGCDDLSVKYTHGEYCYSVAEHIVKSAPAADVEPVKSGCWIVRTNQKTPLSQAYIRIEKTFECSCCGAVHRRRMNYCGECGAKIDGKEVQE